MGSTRAATFTVDTPFSKRSTQRSSTSSSDSATWFTRTWAARPGALRQPAGPGAVGAVGHAARASGSHWKYNREDAGLRRLLAGTAYYGVWDDHEVMNDFGPARRLASVPTVHDRRAPPAARTTRATRLQPDRRDRRTPTVLYRSYRWGKALELVILDTRFVSRRELGEGLRRARRRRCSARRSSRGWRDTRHALGRDVEGRRFERAALRAHRPRHRVLGARRLGRLRSRRRLRARARRDLPDVPRRPRESPALRDDGRALRDRVRVPPIPRDRRTSWFTKSRRARSARCCCPTHAVDDTFHPERLFFYGPSEQPKTFADATRFMNWARVAIDPAARSRCRSSAATARKR